MAPGLPEETRGALVSAPGLKRRAGPGPGPGPGPAPLLCAPLPAGEGDACKNQLS